MKEYSREERFLEMARQVDEGWKAYDRMVDQPIRLMKCLWFLEEEFENVRHIVRNMELGDESFGVGRLSKSRITLSAKYFPKITEALDDQWISYVEVPVVAISALPVEDQKKFRRKR